MTMQTAETDEQIAACYPVMRELRPHLDADAFVGIVRDMEREGYDLVTMAAERSKGYGKVLLKWLTDRARAGGCAELHLDSGIQRKDAHRFYEANNLLVSGYHSGSILLGACRGVVSSQLRPKRHPTDITVQLKPNTTY